MERTRVLAYLVPLDGDDPQAIYETLRTEARAYSPVLAEKPHIVVFTKQDLLPPAAALPSLHAPAAAGIHAISAVSRQGLDALTQALWRLLAAQPEVEPDTFR